MYYETKTAISLSIKSSCFPKEDIQYHLSNIQISNKHFKPSRSMHQPLQINAGILGAENKHLR